MRILISILFFLFLFALQNFDHLFSNFNPQKFSTRKNEKKFRWQIALISTVRTLLDNRAFEIAANKFSPNRTDVNITTHNIREFSQYQIVYKIQPYAYP